MFLWYCLINITIRWELNMYKESTVEGLREISGE